MVLTELRVPHAGLPIAIILKDHLASSRGYGPCCLAGRPRCPARDDHTLAKEVGLRFSKQQQASVFHTCITFITWRVYLILRSPLDSTTQHVPLVGRDTSPAAVQRTRRQRSEIRATSPRFNE